MYLHILTLFLIVRFRFTMTANVLQIDPGGFSKLPVSTRTKGYIEDNCFLASRKKDQASAWQFSARATSTSARLGLFAVTTSSGHTVFVSVSALILNNIPYL
jgi:hypothetical protein